MEKVSAQDMIKQWEAVAQCGALISALPIEEWITKLEQAEAIAPVLDPTLYREYLCT